MVSGWLETVKGRSLCKPAVHQDARIRQRIAREASGILPGMHRPHHGRIWIGCVSSRLRVHAIGCLRAARDAVSRRITALSTSCTSTRSASGMPRMLLEAVVQDSWTLYGVGQGARGKIPEAVLLDVVGACGYELLNVIPGDKVGEELYRVRCRSCGRISVERLGDIVWGCTCSKTTR